VRIGNTIWQPTVPAGKYAADHGCKRVAMLITDYAPGADSIEAFKAGFLPGGGEVVDIIRVPRGTNDFSSYIQRIKDAKPECVFPFMPGGPMGLNYIKSYDEAGLAKAGVVDFGTAETGEQYLPAIGDAAIGMVTAWIYSPYLDNPMNRSFIAGLKKGDPAVMSKFITTFGYDGMEIIFHMLKATDGVRDGDKAIASIKGYAWQSPTGPISIDAKTRDSVRNIYIRKVVKEDGVLFNKEFETIPNVRDQWHDLHPAS
jgi:branched-chain amino acid transport system substrate-binding protein